MKNTCAIYKYSLGAFCVGDVDLTVPAGSEVLSVGKQDDGIVVWVKLTPEFNPHRTIRFRKIFTGTVMDCQPGPGKFLATVQNTDRFGFETVVHVFQVRTIETSNGDVREV